MAFRMMASRPCAVGVLSRPSALRRAHPAYRPRLAMSVKAAAAPVIDVDDDRIPVTVITGFLGSGKTTLLNHLLTQNHGKRIAVIENEFGEIDIDSQLVAHQEVLEGTRDTITQLSNGCLCCTVRDDLINVLINLHGRRQDFDHIVIETTGLANPAPIISTFFMDPELPDKVRLDGVVTVVDAKHVERHLDAPKNKKVVNEAVEQIAYADRIILNKTDLSDEPSLRDLEARLKAINKMAVMQRASRAVVDVDFVLGVGGFELDTIEKQLATVMKEHDHDHEHDHHEHGPDCSADCTHESHKHDHEHGHSHDHTAHSSHDHSHDSHSHDSHSHVHGHAHAHEHGHSHSAAAAAVKVHDDRVTSVSLRLDGEMDLDRVNVMLGGLLSTRSEDLYRMKGILAIQNSDWRYVYQGVHSMFDGSPDRRWLPDERRDCKMVFIGRELDRAVFEEAFRNCLAKPTAIPAAAK